MLRASLPLCLLLVELGCGRPPGEGLGQARAAIVGGRGATECQWPTAVSWEGCGGVLLHPRLVVTAAHCLRGEALPPVAMGEALSHPARSLTVERCVAHPDHDREIGNDIAFCLLSEDTGSVPIVPAMPACEASALLQPGTEATLVGFGDVAEGQAGGGSKRWAIAEIDATRAEGKEIVLGTATRGACSGDSGAPAFLRTPNGEWRAFGVASRMGPAAAGGEATPCASTTVYTSIAAHVAWIEGASGLDITRSSEPLPASPEIGGEARWIDGCNGATRAPAPSCAGVAKDAPANQEQAPVALGTGCSAVAGGSAGTAWQGSLWPSLVLAIMARLAGRGAAGGARRAGSSG